MSLELDYKLGLPSIRTGSWAKALHEVGRMEGQTAGIDIGKKTLYLSYQGKLYKLSNDEKGYEEIRKILPSGTKIILEDSGIYTKRIIRALNKDFEIRIVNPLTISRHKSIRGKRQNRR